MKCYISYPRLWFLTLLGFLLSNLVFGWSQFVSFKKKHNNAVCFYHQTQNILLSSSSSSKTTSTTRTTAAAETTRHLSLTKLFSSAIEINEAPPNIETSKEEEEETEEFDDAAFDILAGNIAICLHKSDLKRDDGFDGASTGWTSWVDDTAALRLGSCMDALELCSFIKNPQSQQSQQQQSSMPTSTTQQTNDDDDDDWKLQRDTAIRWIRFLKNSPAPVITELSTQLRQAVNGTIPNESFLESIDSTREEFLSRIGMRMIMLPSGSTLTHNLRAPPGAMVYGKLLLGGVTRFRMIGSSTSGRQQRRAGSRTLITSPTTQRTSSWLQYGGPERNYEAIDAGPCVFLEVLILPKGLHLPLLTAQDDSSSLSSSQDMTLANMNWKPQEMFELVEEDNDDKVEGEVNVTSTDFIDKEAEALKTKMNQMGTGKEYVNYLESSFTVSVGGLQTQIDNIIRRVLDGRVLSSTTNSGGNDDIDIVRKQEMEALLDLGLQPVRGLLLYGPPGCGKTALAREISKVLHARPAKIVAASELLDRWVGGSEKLVRELFEDAEQELAMCNGDATKSALHVVVIDEIDAVFRKRSASNHDSSGENTRSSVVNQILAKLDGVHELGNILVIGMTNRRELLDPALLRPGRLEVSIEIPLPDQEGRREILQIHFDALRRNGLLSKSLCDAIDGRNSRKRMLEDINTIEKRPWRPLARLKKKRKGTSNHINTRRIKDLAADRWTGGFSGADIAGLVRAAGSLALARARQDGGGIDNLIITLQDVADALVEVKQ